MPFNQDNLLHVQQRSRLSPKVDLMPHPNNNKHKVKHSVDLMLQIGFPTHIRVNSKPEDEEFIITSFSQKKCFSKNHELNAFLCETAVRASGPKTGCYRCMLPYRQFFLQ